MQVMIVEDVKSTQNILKRFVEHWGHEVVVADNGENAWYLYQHHEFPIIISDWVMPQLNGLELVQRIRNSGNPNYCYFILLTAKSDSHDLVIGFDAGIDDFLVKPFNRNELRARLRAGERIVSLQRDLSRRNHELQKAHSLIASIQ